MCRSFYLDTDITVLKKHFNAQGDIHSDSRYNIAPSRNVPVIREGAPGHQITLMQ
jgi:putative SOS response-associated peptidase YedK